MSSVTTEPNLIYFFLKLRSKDVAWVLVLSTCDHLRAIQNQPDSTYLSTSEKKRLKPDRNEQG